MRKQTKRSTMKKGGRTPETEVCVVHAVWCGHCKALMETPDETGKTKWQQVKEKLDGKCIVKDYEQTENKTDIEDLEKKGLSVRGYPTIFKIKNGKIEDFTENPDVDAIVNWAMKDKEMMGGRKKKRVQKTNKNVNKFSKN